MGTSPMWPKAPLAEATSSPPGATQTSVPLAAALGGPGLPADKHKTPAGPPEGPNPPGPLRRSLCALQMDGPCLSARWDRGIYVLKSRFRKLTRVEEQFFHNKSCLQHPGCSAADCLTLSFSQGSEALRVPETLVPSWDRGCDGGSKSRAQPGMAETWWGGSPWGIRARCSGRGLTSPWAQGRGAGQALGS